jgi:glucoamylase
MVVAAIGAASGAAAEPAGTASDGPGALSHYDLARKDCVGTARNRGSKVWFTVADGVLSDVYFPTNDNTNVETLEYVVTDGHSFTDLQRRDMTYTVEALDGRALTCRVTATAKSGRYRIVTDYVTDPDRETVVLRSRYVPLLVGADSYRIYVRFDPTLNGNGGGGSGNGGADSGEVVRRSGHDVLVGSDPVTATNAANRDYAVPVYSALDGDAGFAEVSNGFAGQASDGLTQLDADRRLTAQVARAERGNLVQTARVVTGPDGAFTLALGFGTTSAEAVDAARGTLRDDPRDIARDYARGWHAYDAGLRRPQRPRGVSREHWAALVDEYYLSANYVKASEDKTFPGAVAAALASPWGQAVSAGDPPTRTSARTARSSPATSTRRGARCSPPATARPRAR